jgi:Anti-sigma factor NepR
MTALGKWGEMPMNCRGDGNPASGMTLVGMGRRPRAGSQFDSVRAGIGSALRSLHSDVLREPLPDRIAELLRQLDEQLRQLDQDTDNT